MRATAMSVSQAYKKRTESMVEDSDAVGGKCFNFRADHGTFNPKLAYNTEYWTV